MRLYSRDHIRRLPVFIVAVSAIMEITEAVARVGGGHSYSGSSGGSYGEDGGNGDLIILLFRLVFYYPAIGIPLVVVVGIYYFFFYRSSVLPKKFSTGSGSSSSPSVQELAAAIRTGNRLPVVPMLVRDPNFSMPLFLDFVSALAQRSLLAVNTPAISNLEPYISANSFSSFPAGVILKDVIVGAVTIRRVQPPAEMDRISVAVSFFATEVMGDSKESFWYQSDWLLCRRNGVVSKGPAEMLKLACPSCGASSEKDSRGACLYCGNKSEPGSEAWTLFGISSINKDPRPPVTLGSYADEKGTSLPTLFSPMLNSGLVGIVNWDHGFKQNDAEKRFRILFHKLQESWSNRDLPGIRPLVTDQLYRVYSYWLEAYRSAGIRNVITNVALTSIEIVAAEVDPFYDSITARMHASMIDRCIDEGGKVVGGGNSPRSFSEYWTFIRISGRKRDADAHQTCTGCGSAIEVGMTGECPRCGMLVSGKNFDWILSRIAQDEDYGI